MLKIIHFLANIIKLLQRCIIMLWRMGFPKKIQHGKALKNYMIGFIKMEMENMFCIKKMAIMMHVF